VRRRHKEDRSQDTTWPTKVVFQRRRTGQAELPSAARDEIECRYQYLVRKWGQRITPEEQKRRLRRILTENERMLEPIRTLQLANGDPPAPVLRFASDEVNEERSTSNKALMLADNVLYLSIRELGERIRRQEISPVELTESYLRRSGRLGPRFQAYVSITRELALEQARAAEKQIASGHRHGPLHGIPYAAKDLVAVKGTRPPGALVRSSNNGSITTPQS